MTPEEQLLKSHKRRQANAAKDLERLTKVDDTKRKEREALNDHHTAAWVARKKEMAGEVAEEALLPEGWRELHWKTIVKLAEDTLGRDFEDKDSAVEALEAYENGN